jgi:hypothetical protein
VALGYVVDFYRVQLANGTGTERENRAIAVPRHRNTGRPAMHLVIDKDGNRHGPFNTLDEVRAIVAETRR